MANIELYELENIKARETGILSVVSMISISGNSSITMVEI